MGERPDETVQLRNLVPGRLLTIVARDQGDKEIGRVTAPVVDGARPARAASPPPKDAGGSPVSK